MDSRGERYATARRSAFAAAAAAWCMLCWCFTPAAAAAGSATQHGPTSGVFVCVNRSCKKAGSAATHSLFRDLAPEGVEVEESGCHGQCGRGPNVVAGGNLYPGVYKPSTAAAILEREFNADVPAPLLSAYREFMYAEQELHDGHAAEALCRFTAALAAPALALSPHALCSAHIGRSEALARAARTSSGSQRQQLLEESAAAARAAAGAAPVRRDAWLRLCDALDGCGDTAAALAALGEAEAAGADCGGDGVRRKAERLHAKLEEQREGAAAVQ